MVFCPCSKLNDVYFPLGNLSNAVPPFHLPYYRELNFAPVITFPLPARTLNLFTFKATPHVKCLLPYAAAFTIKIAPLNIRIYWVPLRSRLIVKYSLSKIKRCIIQRARVAFRVIRSTLRPCISLIKANK